MSYADFKMTDEDCGLIQEQFGKLTDEFAYREEKLFESCRYTTSPADPKEIVSFFFPNTPKQIIDSFESAKVVQKKWGRELNWFDRVKVMANFKEEVKKNLHRLVAVIVKETGKDQKEAKAEVDEFIDLMTHYLEIYSQSRGLLFPLETEPGGKSSAVAYKPFGTFAVITPFNFPVAMCGMCFGALLTGNTVVWKSAPETLLTGYLLFKCFLNSCDSELRSIWDYVVCDEEVFGGIILDPNNDRLIDGLAFTGSTEVGFMLAHDFCRQNKPRKVVAETGGNNPCIVTPSANLKDAGWGNAKSAFGACAQKCSAEGRVVAHESIVDELVDSILQASKEMFIMGDPRDKSVTLGPLISEVSYNRYCRYYQDARRDGVVIRIEIFNRAREKEMLNENGYFVDPVIVRDLPPNHYLLHQELFVPILRVQKYSGDISKALELANQTEYGLTAGLFSEDEREKNYFLQEIEAGVTYINRRGGATTGAWPTHQAFGGWKNSGWVTQFGVCGLQYLFNFVKGQSQTVY